MRRRPAPAPRPEKPSSTRPESRGWRSTPPAAATSSPGSRSPRPVPAWLPPADLRPARACPPAAPTRYWFAACRYCRSITIHGFFLLFELSIARITTLPLWRITSRSLCLPPGSISLSCSTRNSGPVYTTSELMIVRPFNHRGASRLSFFAFLPLSWPSLPCGFLSSSAHSSTPRQPSRRICSSQRQFNTSIRIDAVQHVILAIRPSSCIDLGPAVASLTEHQIQIPRQSHRLLLQGERTE